MAKRHLSALPTRTEIRRYIEEHPGRATRRDVARMFGIRGKQRENLRALLAEMTMNGEIPANHQEVYTQHSLPKVTVIEITKVLDDGDLTAHPTNWRGKHPPPQIYLQTERHLPTKLAPGDRLLARLTRQTDDRYNARCIRHLASSPREAVCVYQYTNNESHLIPVDRRMRRKLAVQSSNDQAVSDGDVVVAKVNMQSRGRVTDLHILQKLGRSDSPSVYSLISMHNHGISSHFEPEVLNEAERVTRLSFEHHVDLRDVELLTIDPDDARDHDDAVWARPHPEQPGHWEVIVAISDVALYVHPDSSLDQDAQDRGNSVYFPDRVVPMLPGILSSNFCSLRSGHDRPCMVLRIHIDNGGNKIDHTFVRAKVRVRKNLTYEEAQLCYDSKVCGMGDATSTLNNVFGAYHALRGARQRRSPLNIETSDSHIRLGTDGLIVATEMSPRLDSHRLIEEFMVLANTCAAETLENNNSQCVYRVHDRPSAEKVQTLRYLLQRINLTLKNAISPEPRHLNKLLELTASKSHSYIVSEAILRTQSQACYSTINYGHYGLSLKRYTHFTSPIRRYADLLIHRALIHALNLGDDGSSIRPDKLKIIAAKISKTERRTLLAERETADRYKAAFMADKIGQIFSGHISGVERFGLFINVPEYGIDGLIPISSLLDDFYRYEPKRFALVGCRKGTIHRLGDSVIVRLVETNPLGGTLRFELNKTKKGPLVKPPRGKRRA